MKASMKSIIVLVGVCLVLSGLIAVVNSITAPIIKENMNAQANASLLEIMPNGQNFKPVEFDPAKMPATVTEVQGEDGGGYVITLTTSGYGSGLVIMVGVNADGTISGTKCLASSETLGYEATYGASFIGKDAAGVDAVETVSGATKTTQAYKNAVKDALSAAIILGGGSVDLRTEEEILNDNLSAAFPEAEGKFEKLIIAEIIEGIDAVYAAQNGKGFVYVIGEQFIAVDQNGNTADQTVAAAYAILSASSAEDVDLTAFADLPKALKSVQKTASGNYIMTLHANGYAMTGEHFYGDSQPIVIKVSLTAQGKIIDCLTVSQNESEKFGAPCGKEDFYGQFDGKTESDYKNIDVISGATVTTNAYLKAIENAFASLKILEGGAS